MLTRMIDAVATGKRVGRRETSVRGTTPISPLQATGNAIKPSWVPRT